MHVDHFGGNMWFCIGTPLLVTSLMGLENTKKHSTDLNAFSIIVQAH
jgi:hypothetical protein